MEEESITDDVVGLAYDSVRTIAESLKDVLSHFNISDFNVSDLGSEQIAEAIGHSIMSVSFDGCSVRYH